MLVRASSLAKSMSQYLIDQIGATENIEVLTRHTVVEVYGQKRLEAVAVVNSETGEQYRIDAPALFLFIGAVPHSDCVAGVVERNSAGFIMTGPDLMVDGKRPKGWKLPRDPTCWKRASPASSPRATCARGQPARGRRRGRGGANVVSQVHQYLRTV